MYIENYFAPKGIKLAFFSSIFKVCVCAVNIPLDQNQPYHTIGTYYTIVFVNQCVNIYIMTKLREEKNITFYRIHSRKLLFLPFH